MKKYVFSLCLLLACSQAFGQSKVEYLIRAHSEWIWPRSDAHTVISPLGADDKWKTYIEPGGSFSPGFNSYGVSYLIYDSQTNNFFAPELIHIDEIESFWEEGYLPIYNSKWQAGKIKVEIKLFTEEVRGEVITTLLFNAKNVSKDIFNGLIYLTLRPYGPAGGGPIDWGYDHVSGQIKMAGQIVALNYNKASTFGSVKADDDVTPYIKKGIILNTQDGSNSAVLQFNTILNPEDCIIWHIDFIVHPSVEESIKDLAEYLGKDVDNRLEVVRANWKDRVERVKIDIPDIRLKNAFYSSISQILSTMVHDELRITPISYPMFWLRDSVYMMDLLEKSNLGGFLEGSYEEVVNNIFLSGLGPEADSPGLGLWILGERMKFRPDKKWLMAIYPSIKKKAEVIIQMMTTDKTLKSISPAFLPLMPLEKEFGIYCKPQRDGLIQGIMDTHMPILWVNSWSLVGLRIAESFAQELGLKDDVERFRLYGEKLAAVLKDKIRIIFGQNERDLACIFWPTDIFSADEKFLKDMAYNWWIRNKEHNNALLKEDSWLYFELAQAHNMLYLGYRDKAWMVIKRYIEEQNFPGLYVYKEGDSGCADPTGIWSKIYGWHLKPGNMPHGWISAELALLIRDLLYYEYDDQLIIGSGIPSDWIVPGNKIEISDAPTYFGRLNYKITIDKKGKINLDLTLRKTPPKGILLALPGCEYRTFNTNRIKWSTSCQRGKSNND